jgi:hypothetical protein
MALGPRGMRFFLNLYPPYFFSRTRVKSVSPDWRKVVVELKKSLFTRNYVGTTFGGSLYAACDPFFMLMLINILGIRDHIIWDKGAKIEFKKPARTTITYVFQITDKDLKKIEEDLAAVGKSVPEFIVEGKDRDGDVCVTVEKTVYIRKKK